jgi:hypothetical protein
MSFRPQGEIFAFNGYSRLNPEDFSSFLLEMTLLWLALPKLESPTPQFHIAAARSASR